MIYIKKYENFDWTEDDFDFEEDSPKSSFYDDFLNKKWIRVYRDDWDQFAENPKIRWTNHTELDSESYMDILDEERDEHELDYIDELDEFIETNYVYIKYTGNFGDYYCITYEFDPLGSYKDDDEYTEFENEKY